MYGQPSPGGPLPNPYQSQPQPYVQQPQFEPPSQYPVVDQQQQYPQPYGPQSGPTPGPWQNPHPAQAQGGPGQPQPQPQPQGLPPNGLGAFSGGFVRPGTTIPPEQLQLQQQLAQQAQQTQSPPWGVPQGQPPQSQAQALPDYQQVQQQQQQQQHPQLQQHPSFQIQAPTPQGSIQSQSQPQPQQPQGYPQQSQPQSQQQPHSPTAVEFSHGLGDNQPWVAVNVPRGPGLSPEAELPNPYGPQQPISQPQYQQTQTQPAQQQPQQPELNTDVYGPQSTLIFSGGPVDAASAAQQLQQQSMPNPYGSPVQALATLGQPQPQQQPQPQPQAQPQAQAQRQASIHDQQPQPQPQPQAQSPQLQAQAQPQPLPQSQPQPQAESNVISGRPPYPFDPTKTYEDPGANAWAQYYAKGGDDPQGRVYFIPSTMPGATPTAPVASSSPEPIAGQQLQQQQQQHQRHQSLNANPLGRSQSIGTGNALANSISSAGANNRRSSGAAELYRSQSIGSPVGAGATAYATQQQQQFGEPNYAGRMHPQAAGGGGARFAAYMQPGSPDPGAALSQGVQNLRIGTGDDNLS